MLIRQVDHQVDIGHYLIEAAALFYSRVSAFFGPTLMYF